jgi:hypothetical protein
MFCRRCSDGPPSDPARPRLRWQRGALRHLTRRLHSRTPGCVACLLAALQLPRPPQLYLRHHTPRPPHWYVIRIPPPRLWLALSGCTSHESFCILDFSGLLPKTSYYFKCGDPVTNVFSEEHSFRTLPLPSATSYPARIAIVGDLGLTSNSSTTLDHIIQNDPTLLLVVGDMSYANQYLTTGESASCYSCAFPTSPTRETYQPHWDHWGR